MWLYKKGTHIKMINPINQTNNVKTSIFYINDYHGKSINMERTVTASNAFDARTKKQKDVDTFNEYIKNFLDIQNKFL